MSINQDNANAATQYADSITALCNAGQTSALNFQANQAHNMASAAWGSLGSAPAKVTYHNSLASAHLATAIQLRTAGK